MDRKFILSEIRRLADEQKGRPPGRRIFAVETGIKESDWYGKHWASWGEALREAGLPPNERQGKRDDDELIDALIDLIGELGRWPSNAEIRMRARRGDGFPSHNTLRRLGRKATLAVKVVDRCNTRGGLEPIVGVASPIAAEDLNQDDEQEERTGALSSMFGSVYLLKAGRYYKIGRSNSFGRRSRELAIQLPEKPSTVHVISTDDPPGIESYWHKRFAERRKNGEWFELTQEDVRAFKRRKFM